MVKRDMPATLAPSCLAQHHGRTLTWLRISQLPGTNSETVVQWNLYIYKDRPYRDQQNVVLISCITQVVFLCRFDSMKSIHMGTCKMWSLWAGGLYIQWSLDQVSLYYSGPSILEPPVEPYETVNHENVINSFRKGSQIYCSVTHCLPSREQFKWKLAVQLYTISEKCCTQVQ